MSDIADIQQFLAHSDWLKDLARGIVRDPERADDVVQETWLQALERPPEAVVSPRGWLHRVATNVARGMGRSESARRHRERVSRATPDAGPVDEVVERAQVHALLAKEVLALDEPYRSTILLRYFEGQDIETIARQHDVAASTVRSRSQRALAELRERCERRLGPDGASGGGLAVLAGWCRESPAPLAASTVPSSAMGLWLLAGSVIVGATLVIGLRFGSRDSTGQASNGLELSSALAASASSAAQELGKVAGDTERVPVSPPAEEGGGRVTELACEHVLDVDRPAAEVEVALKARVVPSWFDEAASAVPIQERAGAHRDALRSAWSRSHDGERSGRASTDAGGRFELPFELPQPVGSELLLLRAEVAEDETFRASRLDLVLQPVEIAVGVSAHLHVRRAAHGYLSGRVVTTHGRPVSSAEIRLSPRRSSEVLSAESAEDGSYLLGPLRTFGRLGLEHPEFVPFDHEHLRQDPSGGWKPSDLFVVPSGSLRVRVLRGEVPVANAAVRVWTDARAIRSNGETTVFREGGWNMPNRGVQGTPLQATTGADGWAELDAVWVGKRLHVEVDADGVQRRGVQVRDGAIVFEDLESHASPLALRDRETLELVAHLPSDTLVRGRVLGADGAARAGARVRGYERIESDAVDEALELRTKTDDEGHFELKIPGEHAASRFLVVATSTGSKPGSSAPGLQGLGYAGPAGPSPPQEGATLELTPTALASVPASERRLELVLGPMGEIHGEVSVSGGPAAEGRVSATAHGCPDSPAVRTRLMNSRFELTGLPASSYDLRFEQFAAGGSQREPIAVRIVEAVSVGTRDLRVEFETPGQVEIEVGFDALALGALLYRWAPELEDSTTPLLSPRTVVPGTTVPRRRDFDHVVEGQVALEGELTRLPPLPPGRLQIVLLAHDAEMRPFSWSVLGPVTVRPGSYRVDFELLRTGSVRGRLAPNLGPDGVEALTLVDGGGRSFLLGAGSHWLQSNAQFESGILPVGPDGAFAVPYAPAGTWRMRFGTVAALARGEFSCERRVKVRADEVLWLEVD